MRAHHSPGTGRVAPPVWSGPWLSPIGPFTKTSRTQWRALGSLHVAEMKKKNEQNAVLFIDTQEQRYGCINRSRVAMLLGLSSRDQFVENRTVLTEGRPKYFLEIAFCWSLPWLGCALTHALGAPLDIFNGILAQLRKIRHVKYLFWVCITTRCTKATRLHRVWLLLTRTLPTKTPGAKGWGGRRGQPQSLGEKLLALVVCANVFQVSRRNAAKRCDSRQMFLIFRKMCVCVLLKGADPSVKQNPDKNIS